MPASFFEESVRISCLRLTKRRLVCLYLTIFAASELVYFQQLTHATKCISNWSFSFHILAVAFLSSSFAIFVLVWIDLFNYESATQAWFVGIAMIANLFCFVMAGGMILVLHRKGLETLRQEPIFRFDLAARAFLTTLICLVIFIYSIKVHTTLRRTGGTSHVFLHVVVLTGLSLSCGLLKLVMNTLEYLDLEGSIDLVVVTTPPQLWHVILSQLVPNFGLAAIMLSMTRHEVPDSELPGINFGDDDRGPLEHSSRASRLLRNAGLHPDQTGARQGGLDHPLLLPDLKNVNGRRGDSNSSYIDATAPPSFDPEPCSYISPTRTSFEDTSMFAMDT
eukprot:gb/GEZN01011488.1/.p1 GENE.gb/GEZN01011488.1/~~gb/GEZN01011488.1/.p1  ORF type:complete len:380 (+),score=33.38 gb/GEZN01011488.1/:136-1140(+)